MFEHFCFGRYSFFFFTVAAAAGELSSHGVQEFVKLWASRIPLREMENKLIYASFAAAVAHLRYYSVL